MLLFLQGKIVTAAKITTHILIERQLVVYRRERSAVWQCRFSVDGVWQRTSTHERDFTLAKQRAHDVLVEANVRKKMNVAPITRFFKDVAKNAVLRMQKELLIRWSRARISHRLPLFVLIQQLSRLARLFLVLHTAYTLFVRFFSR